MNAYYKGNPIFGLRGPAGPDGNPIGTVISFMGLTAPKDYLICDGSVYKIGDYPNLAKFFEQEFGDKQYFGSNGDGTFAVPDMRNLFLRGYHGDANESLSGDVGKRQNATTHPGVSSGTGASGGNLLMASDVAGTTTYNNPTNTDTSITRTRYGVVRPTEVLDASGGSFSYTSRPVNMAVLYCIKAVDTQTVYETFEEYDTTVDDCNWHVRKWANGYVEMFGKKSYTISVTSLYGSLYRSADTIGNVDLPVYLIEKYGESDSLSSNTTNSPMLAVLTKNTNLANLNSWDELKRTNVFLVVTAVSLTSLNTEICFEIFGRWKGEVNERIERVTSELLPKSSGSITKDGKQYDYELAEKTVSSNGSSAQLNGIGSMARW